MDRLTREEVAGAVARGYCTTANMYKELDADLITGITNEVMALLQSLSREAVRDEALVALEEGYAVLADITNQWEGRHTIAGQRLLCKMRDAIADATGRSAEDVQDNPIALKREPNAAGGASDD